MPVPLNRLLRELAEAAPDSPALTCGDDTVSRAGLESIANRLARAYEGLGVEHGDFVTIALPNSIEFVAATMACWKLGATPQPVSHKLPYGERAAIIDLAQPMLIVGVEAGTHGDRRSVPIGFTPDSSISDAPIEPDRVSPAWKAPTSGGSTGRPKLIVAGQAGEWDPLPGLPYGMRENGVELVPGPLYHNAPFGFAFVGCSRPTMSWSSRSSTRSLHSRRSRRIALTGSTSCRQ